MSSAFSSCRLRRAAAGFLRLLMVAGAAAASRASTLPEVPSTETSLAPAHAIPHPSGGTLDYQGHWTLAGEHVVEMDPYDLATASPKVSFAVREPSDHSLLYRLRPGVEFAGEAAGEIFSDGKDLAFRTRHPDGRDLVEVRALATGAHRLTLEQPKARDEDSFGHAVWFTDNRILIAAPGHDRYQRDAGAIYVFDRTTGRHVGTVGPGGKKRFFGMQPDDTAGGGPQPAGVPYVQVAGTRALIVHGRRAFVFDRDRLHPLVIPTNGLHRVRLAGALLVGDRVVLSTTETYQGRVRPGRVLGYKLATRRLLYQIRAATLRGSYDFPSRVLATDDRLYVFDALAGLGGTERRGAIHVFDLANGKRVDATDLPYSEGHSLDGSSFTLADDRLWVRAYEYVPDDTSRTTWTAYDSATLEATLALEAPGADRFRGRPPATLPDGRLAVAASRVTASYPWAPISVDTRSTARSSFRAVAIINDPFTTTTAGVLLYDPATAAWTHRLVLDGAFAPNNNWDPQPYENLHIEPGPAPWSILIRSAGPRFNRIVRYDPVLPEPTPLLAPEGRLAATLQSGFSYELFHRASPEDAFAFDSDLGLGLTASFEKIVPYADTLFAGAYRLEGLQISRRLAEPDGEPLALPSPTVQAFAQSGDRLAVITSTPSEFLGTPLVKLQVLDLETRETLLERSLGPGANVSSLALNSTTLAANTAQGVRLYALATGELLPWSSRTQIAASRLVLTEDTLVTTSSSYSYLSGTYTHHAHVSAYSLADGALSHTRMFATKQSARSWDTPPLDLAVGDGAIIVLGTASGGTWANDGRVLVLDLASGDTLHEIASPSPEPGDYFGGWLAAAGPWLAVGASGSSEVFVFDLPGGELRHTLALSDRPEGITNFGTISPRLTIDADTDRLAWFVNDDSENAGGLRSGGRTAVYLFDLNSGLEELKISQPARSEHADRPEFYGVTISGDRLAAPTKAGEVLTYSLGEILSTPLATSSEILDATPTIRLEFPTRRGVSYQPEVSTDDGATWTALGAKHHGDGQPAIVRAPIAGLPAPESLRFRLRTAWESAPSATPFF